MIESDESNSKGYPLPPAPGFNTQGARQEQWQGGFGTPPAYSQEPSKQVGRRRKWIAGLLAFLIPGVGHMYLGLMVKGIVLMLLLALNITAIVYVSVEGDNVLSIVLVSLLVPIVYFFNLFDALQSTDTVNERNANFALNAQRGWSEGMVNPSAEERMARGVPPLGILLFAVAGVIILVIVNTRWTHWLFNSKGSMFGAIVLIGAGVALWLWESKIQNQSRR
ncbi:DUF6677 family protein [Cohnella abietis]|uniref:Uncharacterized protein n=1 Tax=Cohnella abietis TaxID=2507935 RepID=A0A3T1DAW0_9BACL|nr:DUF6677 family protein [Cohnella abietis]BBI35247.1 hypothetical protein KCTCHS21_46460 [Cohnella abietis]